MILLIAIVCVLGVGTVSWFSLMSLFLDGISACLVLAPPIGLGLGMIQWLRWGSAPLRWQILIGAALGIGTTSLLVLGLGLAGVLQRSVWITLLALFSVVGVVRLWRLIRVRGEQQFDERSDSSDRAEDARNTAAFRYLWFLAAPYVVLAILSASSAPGFLWSEEGFGYDVLEYHLQLPKEYLEAGRIHYTPHNVYGNFPANVEMLYLLAMIVLGETVDSGIVANMIHLLLGGLAVFAAWVIGRDESPQCGVVSGVSMAACGWVVYLSGLAYVELGMLFFGMAAMGALLRATREPRVGDSREGRAAETTVVGKRDRTWWFAAGLCAGFACGCKYTAGPMIALPIFAVFVVYGARPRKVPLLFRRAALFRDGCGFLLGAALAFAPWIVKNTAMTGNPLFPLANSWWRASPPCWGVDEQQRWERGHRPVQNEQGAVRRVSAAWNHILADKYQRFGPALFVLAAIGFMGRRRTAADWILLFLALFQIAVWLAATHLYARFAIVLLIPLALLAGRAALCSSRPLRYATVIALCVGGLWNLVFAISLQEKESPLGAPASLFYEGKMTGFEYLGFVNSELPPESRILMIGEARTFYILRPCVYTVVFNRNEFVEMLLTSKNDADVIDWLRARRFTHVLVNWSEIDRLKRTYGFSEEITPERFKRLESAGLRTVRQFDHPTNGTRQVTIYAVSL